MKKWLILLLGVSLLAGCGDGDACDPACSANACMTCDSSGESPRCVSTCGDLECQDGTCMAPEEVVCDPACGDCQSCDTSGTTPVCIDNCAAGMVCNAGACAAPACNPTCTACQSCDTSGATPTCVDNCAAGLVCNGGTGECEAPVCNPACSACQTCDTSGTPTCVDNCATGTTCNATSGECEPSACTGCGPCDVCDLSSGTPTCVSTCGATQTCDADLDICVRDSQHGNFEEIQNATMTTGPEVTATCLTCHQDEADDFIQTAHWNWMGDTPGMEDPQGNPVAQSGKKVLINNFCIANTSNEKRCSQCHAGYSYNDDTFDFSAANQDHIDCLICHADPAVGYSKEPKTGGLPPPAFNLAAAARSVGEPQRANCGKCHFGAGGGDNVKKGDMGSALANPTEETDVHMGRGITCADCHRGPGHTMLGRGVHNPVDEGRVLCEDCHTAAPHVTGTFAAALNNHALDVACQTCHIPAFSRDLPTKMDWDWSTAGNKTLGTDGVILGTLADGTEVQTYNFMKGDFVWEKNVAPELAWYNGGVQRMTINDQFASGMGTAPEPVQLAMPLPHPSDMAAAQADLSAKLFPFKVMRGRTPADINDDFMIVPKLFGPGGFWGGIPDAASYDQATVDALWGAALTAGARAAGQVASDYTYAAAPGTDWDWYYTVMYMGLNHEVAPATSALGCTDCHATIDFTTLGYACVDPMSHDPGGGTDCGNRH